MPIPSPKTIVFEYEASSAYDVLITELRQRSAGAPPTRQAKPFVILFIGLDEYRKQRIAKRLARDLGLGLFQVDLGAVVSRYIQDTEDNLTVIFQAADRTGGLLMFDEADSLFGRRTDVDNGHDRYRTTQAGVIVRALEANATSVILSLRHESDLNPVFRQFVSHVVEVTQDQPGKDISKYVKHAALEQLLDRSRIRSLGSDQRQALARGLRQIRADMALDADQADLARELAAVDFPRFVGDLINGVFDAAINLNMRQMEAYLDLISRATKHLRYQSCGSSTVSPG
jgi:SpoVK/Ycf46/Vps4 family AAA+-type ATPase